MSSNHNRRLAGKSIGILGGGITGLTAAFYLLREGADVTVIEARPELGGLATYFDFGPFHWDKFYHCILTSDAPLHQLIKDLGLWEEMRWTETKVGFFTDSHIYSMSSTMEFLKFPPLSLWQKFRLGLGVLYTCRIKDGRSLESIPVADWLKKVFGKANYEKMWGPLLKCKLGSCREEASAAFIWATITRLYSTRDKNAKKECLGYVRGGYRSVFTTLVEQIRALNGKILTGIPVENVSRSNGHVNVKAGESEYDFDTVISTVPSHTLAKLASGLSTDYLQRLKSVKYLGMVCVVLLLKRKLSPFYVMNLTDEELPFTGVIEMTNLISTDETKGFHLVYLPKYTAPGDALFEASDDEVWNYFHTNLKKVIPDLREDEIEKHFVFRERLVQPLPTLNYSDIVPSIETGIPGLLLANTTQIVNSTLNNNEMVKIAGQAVSTVLQNALSH